MFSPAAVLVIPFPNHKDQRFNQTIDTPSEENVKSICKQNQSVDRIQQVLLYYFMILLLTTSYLHFSFSLEL